jgi:hypothetical protein
VVASRVVLKVTRKGWRRAQAGSRREHHWGGVGNIVIVNITITAAISSATVSTSVATCTAPKIGLGSAVDSISVTW